MDSESMKKNQAFGANKLATTVGANDLRSEIVVSQPRIEILPPKKAFSWRRAQEDNHHSTVAEIIPRDFIPAIQQAEGSSHNVSTSTKRARQRRRQRQARQLAKALEQVDGLRYYADLESRKRRPPLTACSSSKPSTDEWVLVKRTRSTRKERIQKRRARAAQARALARGVVKKPQNSRQVWVPKSMMAQNSERHTPSFQLPCSPSHLASKIGGRIRTPVRPIIAQRHHGASGQIGTPQCTCSCAIHKRTPVAFKQGVHVKAQEPVKTPHPQKGSLKRATPDMALVHSKATTSKPENVNKAISPQKKTCPSRDNVILGVSHQQVMDCSNELRRQAGVGKKSQTESMQETSSPSPYGKSIEAVASIDSCPRTVSQKISTFEKLATEASTPKTRCFHQRKSMLQDDEFPEVTINMVAKQNSAITSKVFNPDFSPRRKIRSGIAQRISQLQLEAIGLRDQLEIHEEPSSSDEFSDTCSAIASDDTASSIGQTREAFMVTPDQVAQIIQDALTRQKESFKFEMDMAMQQMRKMHEQQIQALTRCRNNIDQEGSDSGSDEDHNVNNQNSGGDPVAFPQNHPKEKAGEDKMMKELEDKINALIATQEVKKTGLPCPYPREWESIPFPSKFNLINFTPFDGKGSPIQHLIYFKSHLGVISGNEPLMVRSFVGTLRGAAFDWYRRLKSGSVNSWDDMESSFLNNFFDDDTEVSIGTLLEEKQKDGESIDSFVKRFRNKAMNCRDPITEEFTLRICHDNLSINILEVLGVTPPETWKDLKVRGEQAERFLKRKEVERGQSTVKAPVIAGDVHRQQPWRQRGTPKFQEEYSFDDDEVSTIFKCLLANNKIKLPPIMNQEEANNTSDPNYCAYHRRVHHPTKACITLKNNIQALIDAGVITPK